MTTNARRVRQLREQRAWSQEQLATAAGLSVRTIQRLEAGDEASFETLKSVAATFDVDVAQFVPRPDQASRDGAFLLRCTSGTQLLAVLNGCHGFVFGNDEPPDHAGLKMLGQFFDGLHDCDILPELPPSYRLEAEQEYSQKIAELDATGFWVFAGVDNCSVQINGHSTPWRTAVVKVLLISNPAIQVVNPDNASVYHLNRETETDR